VLLQGTLSKLLQEHFPPADVQDLMLGTRNPGREALAAFFRALAPQRGHWYSVLLSSSTTDFDEQHCAVFPPLSKLASIGEDMLWVVLVHCGLAMFQKGVGHSPLLKAWDYFIHEQELNMDAEVTHYTILKKRSAFIFRLVLSTRIFTCNRCLQIFVLHQFQVHFMFQGFKLQQ
jgi:hypothetical protein